MSPAPSRTPQNSGETEPNRWYLAYGSNLSSDTFRGQRGIRPLAQTNVIAPSLELTFDLPGLPYWEPCFANVRRRTEPSPERNVGSSMRSIHDFEAHSERAESPPQLMGIAYLVTPADYARIVATEGGGLTYQEIVVECRSLPRSKEKDDSPKVIGEGTPCGTATAKPENKVIFASTLLAPDSKRRLEAMQPSKRYIDIIRSGARDNDMPASYITYLDSIAFYHTKGIRQRVGALLFLAMWLPMLLFVILLNLLFADPKTGRLPHWVGVLTEAGRSVMWQNYSRVWKRIFGSGEVTSSRASDVQDLEYGEKRQEFEGITTDMHSAH